MGQWYVRVQIALLAVRNVGRNEMNSSIPKRDSLLVHGLVQSYSSSFGYSTVLVSSRLVSILRARINACKADGTICRYYYQSLRAGFARLCSI